MSTEEKAPVIQDAMLANGFTAVPNRVIFDSGLSMAARCLYAVLLAFARGGSKCVVGQEELAKACGCTDRTVRKYLDELRESGLVSWVQRGLNMPNVYCIHGLSADKTVQR